MKRMIRMFAGMMVLCMLATLIPAAALAGEAGGNALGNTYDNAYEESEGLARGAAAAGVGDYAAIEGGDTRYDTVLEAIAAAEDGDTILVSGRVLWGGNDGQWPEGGITITGVDANAWIITNGDPRTGSGYDEPEKRTTDLGCDVILEDIKLSFGGNMNYIYANGYTFDVRADALFQSCESGPENGVALTLFGGSRTETVESTNLILNGGRFERVYAGGCGQNVLGNTNVWVGPNAYGRWVVEDDNLGPICGIYGGGYFGDVGGNTKVVLEDGARTVGVTGGSVYGDVAGNTHVSLVDSRIVGYANVSDYSIVAGSINGAVEGNTLVEVPEGSTLNGGILGGCLYAQNLTIDSDLEDYVSGGGKTQEETYTKGNTEIILDGTSNGDLVGGGSNSDVKGNTSVIVNGTVGSNRGWSVYGGGKSGEVGGSTYVHIGRTGVITRELRNTDWVDYPVVYGGNVWGGGHKGTVGEDTEVVIDGTVGDQTLGGVVFGGSYLGGSTAGTVHGNTKVTINSPVYRDSIGVGGWGNMYNQSTMGNFCGVYGGGFNNFVNGNTEVIINTDMGDAPVYGGSKIGAVSGNSAVTLNSGAHAETVVGGSAFRTLGGYYESGVGIVNGNARVTLVGDGQANNIYGYEQDDNGASTVAGTASVIFDGNIGAVTQIVNADEVQVVNASDVTIDKDGVDNEQLVNVTNLTVADMSKLTLPASAYILGNYTGAEREDKGTLVLSAGKGLTADGTITNLTDISIVDAGDRKPAEAQVYVHSGAGSTTAEGDYTWIDRRTGLAMEWKDNGDGTSQWWLVKHTEPEIPPEEPEIPPEEPEIPPEEPPVRPGVSRYTLTVRYLDENGEALASAYTTRQEAGTRYDLTAQTEQEIEGYTIVSVEGDVVGTVQEKVVVTVYYEEIESEIPQEPETEIPEEEVPLAPTPELPEEEEEVVIEEPETPMGNLPQTGSVDPSLTLGAAALALSLTMAGLALGLRKKEE